MSGAALLAPTNMAERLATPPLLYTFTLSPTAMNYVLKNLQPTDLACLARANSACAVWMLTAERNIAAEAEQARAAAGANAEAVAHLEAQVDELRETVELHVEQCSSPVNFDSRLLLMAGAAVEAEVAEASHARAEAELARAEAARATLLEEARREQEALIIERERELREKERGAAEVRAEMLMLVAQREVARCVQEQLAESRAVELREKEALLDRRERELGRRESELLKRQNEKRTAEFEAQKVRAPALCLRRARAPPTRGPP